MESDVNLFIADTIMKAFFVHNQKMEILKEENCYFGVFFFICG